MFTIDTGVLFPETYAAWRAIERHYGIRVEIFDALRDDDRPWSAVGAAARRSKVAALDQALDGLDGWITGRAPRAVADARRRAEARLRRARAGSGRPTRSPTGTPQRVWDYIARHDVPYNALHDRGYESIGCEPCTLPGSRARGALGRQREDRVRHPRLSARVASASRPAALLRSSAWGARFAAGFSSLVVVAALAAIVPAAGVGRDDDVLRRDDRQRRRRTAASRRRRRA